VKARATHLGDATSLGVTVQGGVVKPQGVKASRLFVETGAVAWEYRKSGFPSRRMHGTED